MPRGFRTFISMFLAALTLIQPAAYAHSLSKIPSAASLSRADFVEKTYSLSNTRLSNLFSSVGRPGQAQIIFDRVGEKFKASRYSAQINFGALESAVQGWIVMLALSREGYHQAAIEQLSQGLNQTVSFLNKLDWTSEQANELMTDLMRWTVMAALDDYGFLRRHDLERIYDGLRLSAEQLQSRAFAKVAVEPMASAMANSIPYAALTGAGFVAGTVVIPISLISFDISLPLLDYGFVGFLGIILGTAAASISAGVGSAIGVHQIGCFHGFCSAKYKNLKSLGQACAAMLTKSGEIVP